MKILLSLCFLVMSVAAGLANDSEAEIALGGLKFKASDTVSLDREDLFISMNEVRVDYVFTNHGTADVETLVAFPLPDMVFNQDSPRGAFDYASSLDFKTVVDGKPVTYTWVEQAILNGTDVTERVLDAGLPLNGDAQGFIEAAASAPAAKRDALVADGILDKYGDAVTTVYAAKWNLRTIVTRTQVFPAGKSTAVQHRYRPIAGGSVAGPLEKSSRVQDWGREHGQMFCVEDAWYAAFDKVKEKRADADGVAPYSEVYLGYVLSTGANWDGPIKDFRLVIDKGKPENLLSLCAEGVKKISPTQFEIRRKNFEPKDDLTILIVNWSDE
jgi:hypothetical protein